MWAGRGHAELLISMFPNSSLSNIWTPERPNIAHRDVGWRGHAELLISMFPDSSLSNIWTPERPNIAHRDVGWPGTCGTINKEDFHAKP